MSRQKTRNTAVNNILDHPLSSQSDIIDFMQNTPAVSTALNKQVVGGPPAYLEAHGIRYVPEAAAEPVPVPMARITEPPDLDARISSFVKRTENPTHDRVRKSQRATERALADLEASLNSNQKVSARLSSMSQKYDRYEKDQAW